ETNGLRKSERGHLNHHVPETKGHQQESEHEENLTETRRRDVSKSQSEIARDDLPSWRPVELPRQIECLAPPVAENRFRDVAPVGAMNRQRIRIDDDAVKPS